MNDIRLHAIFPEKEKHKK